MKKIKEQKGAITVLVIATVLFITMFLVTAYWILSNKLKTQKETVEQMKMIYETDVNMEEIYSSYWAKENEFIPIYTVEQLFKIGTDELINVDGKYYTFANNSNYILMSDLKFETSKYETLLDDKDWLAVGDNLEFEGNFDGNNHKITAHKLSGTTYVYSNTNGFSEFRKICKLGF